MTIICMEFTIEKLNSKLMNLIVISLTVFNLFVIPVVLPAGNLYLDQIKNLGNVVFSSNSHNVLQDLSFITNDNSVAVSGTVTVIATNSNGEVFAVRQGLG